MNKESNDYSLMVVYAIVSAWFVTLSINNSIHIYYWHMLSWVRASKDVRESETERDREWKDREKKKSADSLDVRALFIAILYAWNLFQMKII